jgi:GT2 family glycosyltransferase
VTGGMATAVKSCANGATPQRATRDDVTVVCVTYESGRLIEPLCTTLAYFKHVIIVDNASKDRCPEAFARRLPHAKIVRNADNKGFGTANNQAIALVQTPYALLLNPDCEIEPAALDALLATAAAYPDSAIVAPQGWRTAKNPQPSYRHAFYEHRSKQAYQIPDATCSAKWLHGCCLLVKVDAFKNFGGFDERFFLFYEDDDLCLRALAAGYDCLLEPKSHVLHVGGASSTPSLRNDFFKQFHFFRSRRLIIGKYLGKPAAWRYGIKTAVAAPVAVLLYIILLRRKHALKWLAWGCSSWLKPLP